MGAINRDHTDHIEDVKDEQSVAGLEMDVPNDDGIVFVAAADVSTNSLPNMWAQNVQLTLIQSFIAARPVKDKVQDEIFPDQMHEVVWK